MNETAHKARRTKRLINLDIFLTEFNKLNELYLLLESFSNPKLWMIAAVIPLSIYSSSNHRVSGFCFDWMLIIATINGNFYFIFLLWDWVRCTVFSILLRRIYIFLSGHSVINRNSKSLRNHLIKWFGFTTPSDN